MPVLTLDLSDDLTQYLSKRAESKGLPSAAHYVQDFLEEQLDDARKALNAELERGFNSGDPVPITPEFWQQMRSLIGKSPE